MGTINTIIGLAVPFFIIGPILMSCLFQWLNSSRHPCRAIIEDEVAKEKNKGVVAYFPPDARNVVKHQKSLKTHPLLLSSLQTLAIDLQESQ